MRYHKDGEYRVVHSSKEDESLGEGWANNYAVHGLEPHQDGGHKELKFVPKKGK